ISSMPREALKTSASKPGVIGVPSSTLSALARAITSCGSEMSAGVMVHHFRGRVAQHPLGADVEDLNDAVRVGGDAREIHAVENRGLQGPRFTQRFLAPDLVANFLGADDVVGKRGGVDPCGHIVILRPGVPCRPVLMSARSAYGRNRQGSRLAQ